MIVSWRCPLSAVWQVSSDAVARLREGRPTQPVWFDSWSERKQDEAATLIATAYRGHVDSEINDQYRSPAGARRFLMNIVQFPGCGAFFQPASYVAVDPGTGRLSGRRPVTEGGADLAEPRPRSVSLVTLGRRPSRSVALEFL